MPIADTHRDDSLLAHRQDAERFLARGEPLAAYDAASEGLKSSPGDVRLRQLRGLSLSRSGAIEAAAAGFRELTAEGCADEETLGNLARTYKAMWLRDRAARGAAALRRQAFEAYRDAFRRTGGYWSGVNAAVMALAEGDRDQAAELARAARELCEVRLRDAARQPGEEYWLLATCGEASLVSGQIDEAIAWYRQAAAQAGKRYANIATTRSQAKLACELLDVDWAPLAACFALPRVVAFTGHLIDAPDRPDERFPARLAAAVEREIALRLDAWGPVIAYSSAACGADLLFLEALVARGHDAVVVLPFPPEQFAAASVDFAGGAWRTRFDAVLARVPEPIVASASASSTGGAAFDYANRMLGGLAKIQADLLGVPLVLLAAWDAGARGEEGGAASMVRRWQMQGLPLEHIDLAALRDRQGGQAPVREREAAAPALGSSPRAPRQRLVAMLFADVQGFSKFSDEQVRPFVSQFLGKIARLMRGEQVQPLTANTWGDGFFAAFASVGQAGRFALQLAELVSRTPWARHGLPEELSIRIALHAGPAYALRDPVTGRPGFWGAHVSRTARIEPITPPGQVYASQAFAALARDEGDCQFTCQYVGRTPLAKGYGSFPTYHVTRARVDRSTKEG